MWKSAAALVLFMVLISWYLRNEEVVDVPKLPNTYWGPGQAKPDPKEIKPFKIDIPAEAINDLNDRLDRTRTLVPPLEKSYWTYGMPSTYLKKVIDYWRHKYNWSQRQQLLNKYPQFTTTIQGLDIHFYHVKPQIPKDRYVRVLPIIMVHGWPGSVVEFQKIIPLLTTPKQDRDFVFELVIPSLPGYGFSKPAVRPGLGPAQMAVVFKNLMNKLGFEKFYTQGGDWGSVITANLAALFPQNVIGAHSNMCATLSPMGILWTIIGNWIPSLVIDNQHYSKMYPLSEVYSRLLLESGYMHIQATKPDTVGTSLSDSPAGLAAYILEKFSTWTKDDYKLREDGGLLEKYTMDELLDNVMVYWLTNSIVTSQRLYAENFNKANMKAGYDKIKVKVPAACAKFPHDLLYQSDSILKYRFTNIIQSTDLIRGGHFAAMEEPELLASDIWSFAHKLEQIIHLEETERLKKRKK